MKNGPCPKCQCRDLYAIERVEIPDHDSANLVQPFALATHYGESGERGFFGASMERTYVGASALVCAACGYTELYTKALATLADFAARGVAGVRKVQR